MDIANDLSELKIFRSFCEHWNEPMFIIKGSAFIECNQAAVNILDLEDKQDIYDIHPSEISPEYQPDGILSYIKSEQLIAKCYEKGMRKFAWLHQNKLQEQFWVEVTMTNITLSDEKYSLSSWREITNLEVLAESKQEATVEINSKPQQYDSFKNCRSHKALPSTTKEVIQNYNLLNEHKKAIDASAIVSKTDCSGIITYVNEKFCELSGYHVKELIGNKHNIINHPDNPKAIFKELWSVILKGNIWQGVIKNKNKIGKSYYINCTICPLFDLNGEIKEFIAICNDVTDLYHQNLIIKNQNTDPITQLGNATKLLSDINKSKNSTLILIKIKELMDIQHAYGFCTYDEALLIIAKELQINLYKNAHLYRWNDDVFAMLISEQCDEIEIKDYCKKIKLKFESRFVAIKDNEFFMSMVIGISINCLCENIFNEAQKALKNSIETSQAITVYSDKIDIQQQLISSINWSKKLKLALSENDIKIFGQDIYDVNDSVYSTEVLMRYFDKNTEEYISPYFFLGYAEKAQLYTKLSMEIIEKSCYYFANTERRFSLNLTMNDIKDKTMSNWILGIINHYEVGNYLTIELVESTNYELESNVLLNFLHEIKTLGCDIAIDDFGSGYSNFDYLMRMPVDIIKIDGSLIKNIQKDKKSFEMVKKLVQFCKVMEMKVVVEYVENKMTFELLKTLDVDYFQGYYFHKPELLN